MSILCFPCRVPGGAIRRSAVLDSQVAAEPGISAAVQDPSVGKHNIVDCPIGSTVYRRNWKLKEHRCSDPEKPFINFMKISFLPPLASSFFSLLLAAIESKRCLRLENRKAA